MVFGIDHKGVLLLVSTPGKAECRRSRPEPTPGHHRTGQDIPGQERTNHPGRRARAGTAWQMGMVAGFFELGEEASALWNLPSEQSIETLERVRV